MTNQQIIERLSVLNLSKTPIFEWLRPLEPKLENSQDQNNTGFILNDPNYLDKSVDYSVYYHKTEDDKTNYCILLCNIGDLSVEVVLFDCGSLWIGFSNLFRVHFTYGNGSKIPNIVVIEDKLNGKDYTFWVHKEYDHKSYNNDGEFIKSYFEIFLYLFAFDCPKVVINGLAIAINIVNLLPEFDEIHEQLKILGLDKSSKELLDEIVDTSNIPKLSEYYLKKEYDKYVNDVANKILNGKY